MVIKNTKIAQFPITVDNRPKSKYRLFVDTLRSCNRAQLKLIINCKRYEAFKGKEGNLISQIEDEVKLWSKVIGPRTIQSLYILHPNSYLEPFELTRVLHEIAIHFKMSTDPSKSFAIVSELEEVTSEHLALVKGLGFTRYQIIIQDLQLVELAKLCRKVKKAKEFSFSDVGIQFVNSDCLQNIRKAIRQLEEECHPDYICVGKEWDSLEVLSSTGRLDNFVVDTADIDVLEFGPDGICRIEEHKVQNYSSPDKYRASLDVERLPIHLNTFRIN